MKCMGCNVLGIDYEWVGGVYIIEVYWLFNGLDWDRIMMMSLYFFKNLWIIFFVLMIIN